LIDKLLSPIKQTRVDKSTTKTLSKLITLIIYSFRKSCDQRPENCNGFYVFASIEIKWIECRRRQLSPRTPSGGYAHCPSIYQLHMCADQQLQLYTLKTAEKKKIH